MRLLIIGDRQSVHVRQLTAAAEPTHEVTVVGYEQLSGVVSGGEALPDVQIAGRSCREFDVVLVRTMPHGTLDQVITSMNLLGQMEERGVKVINAPRALEIAIDKYLTTSRLQVAGLTVPRTVICQSLDAAREAFTSMSQDVVLKPLFGGQGRGIIRVQDEAVLERATRTLLQLSSALYLQAFVPHPGWDYRLLVIGDRVWAIRRCAQGDWRTNLAQGATAEPVELTDDVADIGREACRAIGCQIAGVDVLPDTSGVHHVIEVNAVPGWQGLAAALKLDVAQQIVDDVSAANGPKKM